MGSALKISPRVIDSLCAIFFSLKIVNNWGGGTIIAKPRNAGDKKKESNKKSWKARKSCLFTDEVLLRGPFTELRTRDKSANHKALIIGTAEHTGVWIQRLALVAPGCGPPLLNEPVGVIRNQSI